MQGAIEGGRPDWPGLVQREVQNGGILQLNAQLCQKLGCEVDGCVSACALTRSPMSSEAMTCH